jgi:DNA polymerase I-like protein with 3'-5' exonuclease and polymerase domains
LRCRLSLHRAEPCIGTYFERVPAILAYMERIKTDCRRTGYVETLFGRKCFIAGIRDANPARRAGAERQAINAPLQGSAADIIKRSMGRIPTALGHAVLKARMLLQVHDELLFEVPAADTAHVVKGSCKPPASRIANFLCRSSSRPGKAPTETRRIRRTSRRHQAGKPARCCSSLRF